MVLTPTTVIPAARPGFDSGPRVLKYNAACRFCFEKLRDTQVDLRIRLRTADVVTVHDNPEKGADAGAVENEVNVRRFGVGCHREIQIVVATEEPADSGNE